MAANWWGLGTLKAAQDKPRIRVLFAAHAPVQPGPDWPNVGYDFRPFMGEVEVELRQQCPAYEFVSSVVTGPDQAEQVVAKDAAGEVLGYVVVQLNPWNQVAQTVAATGKPLLYADYVFAGSGGFLVYNAAFLRSGARNVGFVSSSRLEDLVAGVRCFDVVRQGGNAAQFVAATNAARRSRTPSFDARRVGSDPLKPLSPNECVQRLKQSKILLVRDQESGPSDAVMGITVQRVAFAELNDAWKKADRAATRAVADRWAQGARQVDGVSRETLETSAAMYLAEKALLERHGAMAISINCLGGFYGGHIHAYPCLGFHELLNEGLVGACEADLRSTATMVALTTLTQGRPGYISDPVIDTSKRQIIYAHCVASNRPFGPSGRPNPFDIMTHSEDRQGASVRSFLPAGFMTTTLEIAPERKEVLLHQGKAVANDPDDRACRTKLCVEPVGDVEKLFTEWDRWGWHRVTYYGDLKASIQGLAEAFGWNVVEEA
jgi:hypothetical protein